jgi:hypothetical protein
MGRPRIGVRGGFLDVAQWDAGVGRGGDEGVSQCVRADLLIQSRAAGHAAHDSAGAVSVHALSVGTKEDRPVEAFADG